MRCEGIHNVVTIVGVVQLIVFGISIVSIGIYNAVEARHVGSDFMTVFLGSSPRTAISITVAFGILFIAGCIGFAISLKVCNTCAFRSGLALSGCIVGFGAVVLMANGVLLSKVTLDNCDTIELVMIAMTVANTTEGPIYEWKKERKCLRDPSFCILECHEYVEVHCKRVFVVDVVFESVAICFFASGIGCAAYGCLSRSRSFSEEEDGEEESVHEAEEPTDYERALANARHAVQ